MWHVANDHRNLYVVKEMWKEGNKKKSSSSIPVYISIKWFAALNFNLFQFLYFKIIQLFQMYLSLINILLSTNSSCEHFAG